VGYLYLIVLSTKFPRGSSVLGFHSWLVPVLLSISFQLLLKLFVFQTVAMARGVMRNRV